MSTTLTIAGLDVRYGARTLVQGLDLVLSSGGVTALVGANGSGKSSLMRTIIGELPVESGSIRLSPPDATIGWLPQSPPDPDESLLAYTRRRTGVAAADRALDVASSALASGEGLADDEYAVALEHWLALGGADLEDRLPQVAARLGLDAHPDRPLGTLSGGQAARAALATILLSRYEVLLLDEPTNNLDATGLELMVDFVTGHEGPVMVASHDRDFLDRVATQVVELDLAQQRITHHAGSYTDFVAARSLERRQAREAFEEYAGTRDRILTQSRQRADWAEKGRRNVKRSDEADKNIREKHKARADRQAAKAARLQRSAERLAVVDQPRKEWELRYTIDPGAESAEVVWTLDRLVLRRGEFELGPIDLTVSRGDRLLLAGDNGTGKTTLLAAMLGSLSPALGSRLARLPRAARPDRPGAVAALLGPLGRRRGPRGARRRGRGGRGAHAAGQVRAGRRARGPARPQPVAGRAHPRVDGVVPGPRRSTCWCSTSRPTISTYPRSSSWSRRSPATPGRSSWSATTRRSWSGSGSTRCSPSPEVGGQSQRGSTGRRRSRVAAMTPPTAPPRWACHDTS